MASRKGQQETYRPAFEGSDFPHISYGIPFSEACQSHIEKTFRASRVFIIASKTLSNNTDNLKSLQAALGKKVVGTRVGMTPHTLWSECLSVTEEARQARADLLITLDAGSLTDAAKIIAPALANDAMTFEDLDRLDNLKAPDVPIVSIPTSLSGGEYSNLGGGTNDHTHQKHAFTGPIKGPALVILDPALSTTTPDSIWLSTGIRAVDHCVEAMCSLSSTEDSDRDSATGLRLLVPGLLRCKHNKQDLEARQSCMLGVIDAIKGVFQHNVPLGASHGIGHQLGPLGVGHGETSCILLPAVCKYNVSANGDRQRKVYDVLCSEAEVDRLLTIRGLSKESANLGDLLDAIISELGMPRNKWCKTNPIPLESKGQIMEILEMVVE
ncbi:putative Fe-containing alcohol dehydrogenase [Cryomyces antarcticus]